MGALTPNTDLQTTEGSQNTLSAEDLVPPYSKDFDWSYKDVAGRIENAESQHSVDATSMQKVYQQRLRTAVETNDDHSLTLPTKTLLLIFGYQRRRSGPVTTIENWLKEQNFQLAAPLMQADYYGTVTIALKQKPTEQIRKTSDVLAERWMLSALKEDGSTLDCLSADMKVRDARETMRKSRRKNMPVFFNVEDQRSFIGNVSLETLFVDFDGKERDPILKYVDPNPPIMPTDTDLQYATSFILENDFIYGRSPDGAVVDIYTKDDLVRWMHELSSAFLQITEVERLIRARLENLEGIIFSDVTGIPPNQIRSQNTQEPLFPHAGSQAFPKNSVSEMTFMDYIACFANDDIWGVLTKSAPYYQNFRDQCVRNLDKLRERRNDIMHLNNSEELSNIIAESKAAISWLQQVG